MMCMVFYKKWSAVFTLALTACLLGSCGDKKETAPAEPAPAAPAEKSAEPTQKTEAAANKTLANAMNAFNGESNATRRYEAFAAKADEEGYKDVANLFRAASKAESVHAASLAEIIQKMGGTATPTLTPPDVKTTAENVQVALAGETEEYTKMYPEYIDTAKTEGNMDAVRIFNGAKSAEESHAKFYKEAGDNLESWKEDTKSFFVCNTCGYTVTEVNFDKCPICFAPKEKYEKIV